MYCGEVFGELGVDGMVGVLVCCFWLVVLWCCIGGGCCIWVCGGLEMMVCGLMVYFEGLGDFFLGLFGFMGMVDGVM